MGIDNFGGISKMWVADAKRFIIFWQSKGIVSRASISFYPGFFWREVKVRHATTTIKEKLVTDKQGDYFNINVKAITYQDTEDSRSEISSFPKRVVIAIKDSNGLLKVYGNPKEPLDFFNEQIKGKRAASENNYAISLKGNTTVRSSFIDTLGVYIGPNDGVILMRTNTSSYQVQVSSPEFPYTIANENGTSAAYDDSLVNQVDGVIIPNSVTWIVPINNRTVPYIRVVSGQVDQVDLSRAINKQISRYWLEGNPIVDDVDKYKELIEQLLIKGADTGLIRTIDARNIVPVDNGLKNDITTLNEKNIKTNSIMLNLTETIL